MVRSRPAVAARAARKAKIFAITKGFRGRARNCFSIAVRAAEKALQHAYRARRLKKRDMRRLWIQRVSYAAKEHGINYSTFMHSMVKCKIQLNRKVMSELAIHEPRTFQALAEIAKRRQEAGLLSALDTPTPEGSQEGPSPSPSSPHGQDLYATQVVTSDSGRRVLETAV